MLESTSVSSAKLNTPESDGFIADTNAVFGEQIPDITIAEVEPMLEPNRVTDDGQYSRFRVGVKEDEDSPESQMLNTRFSL